MLQGIKLLSKRVSKNSLIAVGFYGAQNKLISPHIPIDDFKDIVTTLNASKTSPEPKEQIDGINIAFNMATLEFKDGIKNTVIILRSNQVKHSALENTTSYTPEISEKKEKTKAINHTKLGGAIALTAITILPDVLEIIKD